MENFNNMKFESYFNNKIKKYTHKFEQKKKKYITKIIIHQIKWTLILLPLFLIFFGESLVDIFTTLSLFIGVVGTIFLFLSGIVYNASLSKYKKLIKQYKSEVKKEIFPKILEYYNLSNGKSLTRETAEYIRSLGLLPSFEYLDCDDYIEGEYKGLQLKILEIQIGDYYHTKHGIRKGIAFDGILIIFKDPNEQKAVTMIKRNGAGAFMDKGWVKSSKYVHVQLEDPEFEKQYDVISTDQVYGRNTITPAFMNKIVKINKHPDLDKGRVKLSFEQQNINITIDHLRIITSSSESGSFTQVANFNANTDWFDISMKKRADDINAYAEIVKQLDNIFFIIDTLNFGQE